MTSGEPVPTFVPLKKAAIGSYWSNKDKDGKHFKNYEWAEDLANPSEWQEVKHTLRGLVKTHAKPKDGYTAFGKTWYAPCDMGASVAEWRSSHDGGDGSRVYFIGHATQLLCLANGVNILLDPIFSQRASPVSFAGPSRHFPPATTVDQLPPIHIVTVSHNHCDHMDKKSLRAVSKRFPDAHFVLPLGMERFMKDWGVKASITTLDWYDECDVKGVRIGCTPAQHWGQYWLCDRNEGLWCGWCIGLKKKESAQGSPESTADKQTLLSYTGSDATDRITAEAQQSWSGYKKYFFSGDIAYNSNVSKNIYAHFGPMDMASLPIGAYGPRELMARQHVDPEHAVQVFQDQHIQRAMAVHWATFNLSDEPLDEPPQVLAAAVEAAGIAADRFQAIPMGKFIDF